jgi:uncharacterized membrane protein
VNYFTGLLKSVRVFDYETPTAILFAARHQPTSKSRNLAGDRYREKPAAILSAWSVKMHRNKTPLLRPDYLWWDMPSMKHLLAVLLLVGYLVSGSPFAQAQTNLDEQDQPVVRVLMFWLGSCGHCAYVIKEVLPPLQDHYGDQLEILLVELVTEEDVDRLYQAAAELDIPKENVVVPFMIIGERVLTGSQQIPNELPGLIETYLASGGIDFPRLPSLAIYLPEPDETSAESQSLPQAGTDHPAAATPIAAAEDQSNGFTLALVVLGGMVAAIVYVIFALLRNNRYDSNQWSSWIDWLIPLVALAGLGVAGYLTYVETEAVEAFCGPIGDCNTVQSSSYARVMGVLPVGMLGLLGYAALLIAWVIQNVRNDRWAEYARLAMFGMALFGTLYSIYLTYVEIWVILAVCMWCLISAALIATLMLLSVRPAREALESLGGEDLP